MAMLIRLLRAAITAVLLNKMIRGVLVGFAIKSMRRIMSPSAISTLMMLVAMLTPLIDSRLRGKSKSQKKKNQIIDFENYHVD